MIGIAGLPRSTTRVLSVNTTAVGNVDDGADDLMTYTIPAGAFERDGDAIRVTFAGSTAANGNTKTVAVHFGATNVGNVVNAALNGGTWGGVLYVVRTAVDAQRAVFMSSDTAGNNAVTRTATPAADLTGAVVVKLTGTSASNATDDVVQRLMIVELIKVP